MNPRYMAVAPRAAHRCEYCRAPEVMFNFPFEVEHIIPQARGGADVDTNWALACRSCNLHKASRTRGRDPATGDETRLFNPRENWWHQHFRVDNETRLIEGITPIGRATV